MIAFIDDHRGEYGVEPICKVLPIAPSTYHDHVAKRLDPSRRSARAKRDEAMKVEAHRWGLVNEVLPGDALEARVWEIARLLASGPPLVFAAIKEVARESEAMSFRDAMNRITRRQFRTVDELYGSEDNREGFRAFAEKRDPVWKGR